MLSEQQLAERRQGIGGSDCSAVLGLNPFKTPLDLYYEKLGEREDIITNEDAVHFGNVLEDIVAEEYTRRTGDKVHRVNQPQVHLEHDFMRALLDRRVVGKKKVMECKTANQYTAQNWGPSGTDEVPEHYLLQTTHYMGVMGWNKADLAVLIGGQDFRIYNFKLDQELLEMVIEAEKEFWQRVQDRNPPAAINKQDIDTYMAIDNGESITASQDVEQAVTLLKDVKGRLKELDSKKTELETQVKVYMGENSVLVNLDGSPLTTFKKSKDSNRFDAKALKAAEPEIHAKYTKPTPGSRRFLVK